MTEQPKFSLTLPEVVVVTGTGSGLGMALAGILARAGVTTIGLDVAACPAELDGIAHYSHIAGDVTGAEVWDQARAAVEATGSTRLGYVPAAAILDVGLISDLGVAHLERALRVNVVGAARGFEVLLPLMERNGGGTVVAIGSIAATFAEQQLAAYSASKSAVRALARTIALDYARKNIRVNVVSPGPMLAGLFKRHMESADDPQKFYDTRARRQPSGKILLPEEVAQGVLFLLSDEATAFNGADLMADGGLTTSFDFRTGEEGASIS